MTAAERDSLEQRLLVLAPTAKDAALTQSILDREQVRCTCCPDLEALCAQLNQGAGAVLITEEALIQEDRECLASWMRHQPPWSDLPVLVLARSGADSAAVAQAMDSLRNVTVLERPVRVAILVSAVHTALRARRRQYEIRDYLAEQERSARELRHREERFRLMANTTPAMIWTADPSGAITFHNQRWLEYTGLSIEENVLDWPTLVLHPEDRERCIQAWTQALRQGTEYEVEVRNRRHDGQYRWFMTRATPIRDANGQVIEWYGSTTDIHDRKGAELTLRIRASQQQAIAQLGDLALRERDLQKVFEYASTLITHTLEVEYCKILELLPDARRLLLRAGVGWKENLVGQATVPSDLSSQAGYTLWSDAPVVVGDLNSETRFNGPPLLFDHGVVSGMSCIIRRTDATPWGVLGTHSTRRIEFTADDVSFLVAVANILGDAIHRERTEKELKDADRRKDEFLAMLAHELRNPLAPIRNSLHIMRLTTQRDPAADRVLEMMNRQVNHMVRLVDDLLDVSRITRGKIELRKEPIEMADIVRSAVETSRPLIEAAGHNLVVALPPAPLTLEGDSVRLAQVIANLLNNAAKYTDPGGQIRLTVEREGGWVTISVQDTGTGIPPEMIPRVFDLFTQIDGHSSRAQGGLGIGLALVKSIVEMHGGSVRAQSEGPGRGSEFQIRLPLLAVRQPRENHDKLVKEGSAFSARRIFVVDDNRDAAQSLARVLKLLGAEVHVAYDGLEALKALQTFRPSVMLLDIGMPGMDGHELARRIRQLPEFEGVKLIALTGWGQQEDQRRSLAAGFDYHLIKPADVTALQALLMSIDDKQGTWPKAHSPM